MVEKSPIEPRYIGSLVAFLSGTICGLAETNKKKKPIEMTDEVEAAVAIGILIGGRYAELASACTQWWDFNHAETSKSMVDTTLSRYQEYLASEEQQG